MIRSFKTKTKTQGFKDQNQDFESWVLRRRETKTQVSRTPPVQSVFMFQTPLKIKPWQYAPDQNLN